MTDATIQTPTGKLNNARYELDFYMIPKIFHRDPADFIVRCQRTKGGYLSALFNKYYDIANSVFFFNNPKHFSEADFTMVEAHPAKGQHVLYISLPTEHEGSLVYCTGLAIAYEKKLFTIKNPRFFLIERQLGGIFRIGSVDPEGNFTDHCDSSGTVEGDIALIHSLASEAKTE